MISVDSGSPGALRDALNQTGWLDEPVLAAGQLRQSKLPTTLQMVTGAVLWELWRPRRCKALPRHFIMALTATQAHAFKAVGGAPEGSSEYIIRIFEGVRGSFPRASVSLSDLPEGAKSNGATMTLEGQSFPVSRPNLNGDPNTDELIALLAGLPAPGDGTGDVPPASRGDLVV